MRRSQRSAAHAHRLAASKGENRMRSIADESAARTALLDLGSAGTPEEIIALQQEWGLEPSGELDRATMLLVVDIRDAQWIVQRRGHTHPCRVVKGRVASAAGEPAPDLSVQLVEPIFRGETLLVEGKTNKKGQYELVFPRGKIKLPVFARVLDGSSIVAQSYPQVVSTPFAEIDLTVDPAHVHSPTEFERIRAEVTALAGTIQISALREDDTSKDITFLASATACSSAYLVDMVMAHRLGELAKLDPAFFYALLREGVLTGNGSSPLQARYQISLATPTQPLLYDVVLLAPDTVRSTVQAAVAARIAPATIATSLDATLAVLAASADAAHKYYQTDAPQNAFQTVASNVAAGNHDRVIQILQQAGNGDPGQLLGNFKSVPFASGANASADVMAAFNDLLTSQPVIGQVLQGGLANGTSAATAAPAATAAFAADLEAAPAKNPGLHAMLSLLRANPSFDLTKDPIHALLRAQPPQSSDPKDTAALNHQIKSIQRIFKLAPTSRQTSALLDAGIHSAAQISGMGRTQFVRRFAANGTFTADEADVVFRRAHDIHIATGLMAAEINAIGGMASTAATAPAAAAGQLRQVSQSNPNLKNLFWLIDLCACDDCRSIAGPAAYLCDVLQYLKQRMVVDTTVNPPVATKTAKEVLFARRPDLGDIDLTCNNTNVPLPYIDVVCELLEQAVSPDPGIPFSGAIAVGKISGALQGALSQQGLPYTMAAYIQEADAEGNFYVRDAKVVCKIVPASGANNWTLFLLRQTFGTADELAAAPEYVNNTAYQTLAGSKIAFHLPFDLPHEESRAYFSQFGVGRDTLMRALAVGGVPAASDIAVEQLDIADGERKLIGTADAANQNVYWNTGATDPTTLVNVVDTFLTRTELAYADLEQLLALSFINPSNNLFIQHLDSTCDTQQKKIANLDAPALDRIHRFLRLLHRLGWNTTSLNEAVEAPRLGNGQITDDPFLVRVADLLTLQAGLGISIDDLIIYFGTIPTTPPLDGSPSRYAQIFLNSSANGIVDVRLAVAAVTTNQGPPIPQPQVLLTDVAGTLTLTLGVKTADLTLLIAARGANNALTFDNLAALYSQLSLAKALGLSIGDFLLLEAMTAIDPLASPSAALAFVDASNTVTSASIKLVDLRFWLSFVASDVAVRSLSDAAVTAIQTPLQAALQAAYLADRSLFDPSLTADENEAALAGVVGKLPGVSAAQLSKLQAIAERTYADAMPPNVFLDALLGSFVDTTAIKGFQTALQAAVTPADVETARENLIQGILDTVSSYFHAQARIALVPATLATSLHLDSDLAVLLLNHAHLTVAAGRLTLLDILGSDALIDTVGLPPTPPAITPATFADQYAATRLLQQIAQFSATLGLGNDDLKWLLDNAGALGWLQIDLLPYQAGMPPASWASWYALQQALGLFARYPAVVNPADASQPFTLRSVFDLAVAAGTSIAQLLDRLTLVTGWDRGVLGDLDALFGFSAVDLSAYKLAATYVKLENAVVDLRKLGLTVAGGVALIKPQLLAADALSLRQALKTRYDASDWLAVLKQIYDPLRQQKRDALVAYLLSQNTQMASSDDLFDYFLVDVEMCSCQPTSRIVSAHGSVQLFVQRCLLGIEPTAVADVSVDDGWDQWSWMQAYRVWQANREVFLYPENWINPPLRDDKSEPYIALENALAQSDLSADAISDAAIQYLETLDDLAFLEVVTMYYDEGALVLYVFARTKGGDPHTYYYRQFIKERTWTPWSKVDIDIKGDHLIAFIRNGRINLAWPIFSELANQDQDTAVPNSTAGTKVAKTQKQWQIQLSVSELANGVWLPSRTSKESLAWTPNPGFYEQLPLQDYFRFVPLDLRAAGFSIGCSFVDNGKRDSSSTPTNEVIFLGGFTLSGCKGYPEPYGQSGPNLLFLPNFLNTDVEDLRWVEISGNELSIMTFITQKYTEILANTPNPFKVTYPQQITLIDYIILLFEFLERALVGGSWIDRIPLVVPLGTLMPYFFEDSVHNYVIIPGLFSVSDDKNVPPIRRTFSDILTLVQDIVALLQAYLLKLEQDPNHDLAALLKALAKDPDFLAIMEELKIYVRLRPGIEFDNFYHPLICPLRKTMYSDGIDKLMDRATQLQVTNFDFQTNYTPKPIVHKPYPIEDIDFTQSGSYSSYNWELFFHLPLAIAVQLTQDQQFATAMDWFHYIFNPTDASSEPVPRKYWQTKPFFLTAHNDYISERIDTIMNGLAADPSGGSIDQLRNAVQDWRANPFEPFLVARSRTVAFQQAVLMKYLDNLIAWGDSLFTQDTMETVNQATQMYVLADKLLGPRPRIVPPVVTPPPETYNQLEGNIDLFGNELLDLENLIPDLSMLPHGGAELPPPPLTLSSLYFCIPPNPNLGQYWDTVADRLFKIRNCQDINGVERTLALFAPPIDPGALIAALAAGLSVSQILSGLNAPLPLYRFSALMQKATELTHLVSQLGSSMLQALEKRDAEALSRLRSTQEIALLNAMLLVKQRHVDEATTQIDVIQKSIDLTTAKSQYYHSRPYMNSGETAALVLNAAALVLEAAAMGLDTGAAIAHMLPTFSIGIAGFGGSPAFTAAWGSENIAGAASGFAQVTRDITSMIQGGAQMASTMASYDRRQDEWTFQAQLADLEIIQLNRQMDAAKIRLDIAQKEVAAHQLQIDNAKRTDQFLRTKFTNTELFDYMVGQVSAVFYRSYQLALNVAHQAERCFQFELGTDQTFIQYNYWDSLKKGLLSGERLMSDVKQMDVAYMQLNKREYELTKHLSLAQLDPLALLQLKATGACIFSIPEASFDADHPGHYFRRLKTVALTIPCVVGPYTSVSAKLSLVGSRYRNATSTGSGYPESPGNDTRFSYNVTAIQSVATSQGESDSGLFELSFHDERYLPFEYAGAISSWRLELPQGFPQFDYNAIADVVLKLRYTARDGGSGLRGTVEKQLRAALNAMLVDAAATGLYQGFDLRRQFPDEWYQLTQTGSTSITITTDMLPFIVQQHGPAIDAASWIAELSGNPASTSAAIAGANFTLSASNDYGGRCKGDSAVVTLGTAFTLTAVDFSKLEELSFVIHFTLGN
jgi:hypothetical protein